MMKRNSFLLLVILLFLTQACKEDGNPLPYSQVNFSIQPDSPLYPSLNTVGGYAMLTANYPSRGVIVYRLNNTTFKAYERTCPYDADACCTQDTCTRLIVQDNALIITDPCCGSEFLILDGSVSLGPSTYPLKQYAADYDGTNLHIYENM